MDFYELTVSEGQSIYDLAVQVYGGVDGVFALRDDNPTLIADLNTDLVVGWQLNIRKDVSGFENPEMATLLRKRGVVVVNGLDGASINSTNADGSGMPQGNNPANPQ